MIALRILNLIVWGVMAAYMLPGAWSALFGRDQRRGDAMRLACLATALLIIGFNGRALFFPDNIILWQILLVGSIGDGCYIIWLAWAYGRGPRV